MIPTSEVLLERDAVPDPTPLAAQVLGGARVLVLGAGSPQGAALVHQLLRLPVERVYAAADASARCCALRIPTDEPRIVTAACHTTTDFAPIMAAAGADVVFHTGHCVSPSVADENPQFTAEATVLRTEALLETAWAHNVSLFVHTSAATAAAEDTFFGHTQIASELLARSYPASVLRTVVVRPGPILGAPGSVLTDIGRQVSKGLPVKVSHPGSVGHFCTPTEAAVAMINAAAVGVPGDVLAAALPSGVRLIDLIYRYALITQLGAPRVVVTGSRTTDTPVVDLSCIGQPTPVSGLWRMPVAPVPASLPGVIDGLHTAITMGYPEQIPWLVSTLMQDTPNFAQHLTSTR